MKTLLIISPVFAPLQSVVSLHLNRVVRGVRRSGWYPTVLTVDPKYSSLKCDPQLSTEVPQDMEVIRTRTLEHRGLALVSMPDPRIFWYPFAVREARRLLAERKFHLIYSRATPFTSHLVGLAIKQASGLPWVAHFGDPWTDGPYVRAYTPLHRIVNRYWERQVIRFADGLVFTNKYGARHVMSKYPQKWLRKAFIVPHGFDPNLRLDSLQQTSNEEQLTLMYTGGLYQVRSPIPFFSALSRLQETEPMAHRIRVYLVGGMERRFRKAVVDYGLQDVVQVIGKVSFSESLAYAAKADVLLLIDAPSEGPSLFLPSKLIQYLAFGKPIFGITPPQGPSADVLQVVGGMMASPTDVDDITSKLQALLYQWQAGTLQSIDLDSPAVRMYHVDNTTRMLAEVFDSVASSGKTADSWGLD